MVQVRYYAMGTTLKVCVCGGTPQIMSCRIAEDAEEAWVECGRCGRETERCEDAYADFDTAEWLWQEGKASIPQWRQSPQTN